MSAPPNHSAAVAPAHGPWSAGGYRDTGLRKSQVVGTVSLMSTAVDRVRDVIARTGMSQNDFAAAVGLDAPKLSKSLGGARRFSSLDYARIADIGGVSVDWLLGGREPALAMAARRAAGSTSQGAVAEAERIVELRATASELGYDQALALVRAPDSRGTPRSAGQALAAAASAVIDSRGRNVTSDDLAWLIEGCYGVDVGIVNLGKDFDGLSVLAPGVCLILASPTALAARQRFTVAHELGHVLAGDDQGVHLDQDIYDTTARKDATELRANAFAAVFLMPERLLADRVTSGFDEEHFCHLVLDMKVSPSALAIRLADLRLIDAMAAELFKSITYQQAAKRTGRATELAALAAHSNALRPPGLLAGDLFAAYTAGETTLRPYASLLGVDPVELRAGLEAPSSVG